MSFVTEKVANILFYKSFKKKTGKWVLYKKKLYFCSLKF